MAWAGGATRVAKAIGVTPRDDVQAIIDDANAQTAVLRNEVIGTQTIDLTRDLNRMRESILGDLVADAMLAKYPGVEAAFTNSGGLRASILQATGVPPGAPGEITWGEVFALLPFGNRTVIFTLTGDQLTAALLNGFSTVLRSGVHGRNGAQPTGGRSEDRLHLHRHDADDHRDVQGAARRRR